MTFSNFAITGYFDPAAPPELRGSIAGFLYWHEGLDNWLELTDPPPTVPPGTQFHTAVMWINESAGAMSGHVELTITKPDGARVTPLAVENQNRWAAPGNGWIVRFEAVILDQGGDYQAEAALGSIGETLDQVIVPLVSVPTYEASAGFTRERACMEGHMDEDGNWVCTRYSDMERIGTVTVTNEGAPASLTTVCEVWLAWSRDWDEHKEGDLVDLITSEQWTDYFTEGQTREYRFNYIVGVTGMPLNTRIFIKVFDPAGNVIVEREFVTPL